MIIAKDLQSLPSKFQLAAKTIFLMDKRSLDNSNSCNNYDLILSCNV